ncbi:similar to Saccharomyces cerevisiae YDR144C MKC7 GPI-anchored aspartyl protease, member of the yapsin family of proteases involved in cell wall growth and maintenance [Maudiozyma saulgeensis]|uniref:Similar to Saccharomyces cerevisiae YDR144C MKC7 GPI-anchored aspartyl protease, member of the yapsin family of proteases involved in cell wall growth and maintenance n=1 Tax=Maudiozyma saulgeensis TaxID=1789683 RepID=A0A1X7R4A8_9SACH|nr:similar to Saccharomyces cerevisiae YDR144C MKC7 GPI-anchored aspartyl protease, member of the yapsin family of proteases involved in cell wall growth and maintenance [Kazachstania saulgeensis]
MKLRDLIMCVSMTPLTLATQNCSTLKHIEEKTNKDYVHMTFKKTYGDSYENSSRYRTDIRRIYKRDSNGFENLTMVNQNSFYSLTLGIGSNSQNVTVLVDTGSSDLWIMGDNNPYCDNTTVQQNNKWYNSHNIDDSNKINCTEYGTFDSTSSKSFKSNATYFSILYGDKTRSSGIWGYDNVTLPGTDVILPNLSFGVANLSNSSVGVLGIGYPQLEVTYSGGNGNSQKSQYMYNNFPLQLKQQGNIKSNVYSLYLGDSSQSSMGNILFGAVDHSRYSGQLFTVPIINTVENFGYDKPIQFDITMNGVGITINNNETTITETKMPALLDSGTSLIYLPRQIVSNIAKTINATQDSKYGYIVPCNILNPTPFNDTDLVFNFNGVLFHTDINNFLLQISSDTCMLGIIPSADNSTTSTILGDLFLSNAYIVYDLDNYEISLAPAKFNITKEESNIEVINSNNGTIPNAKRAPGYNNTWSISESYTTGGNIFTLTIDTTTTKKNKISTSKTNRKSINSVTSTLTVIESRTTTVRPTMTTIPSSSSSSSSSKDYDSSTTKDKKKKKSKKQKQNSTSSNIVTSDKDIILPTTIDNSIEDRINSQQKNIDSVIINHNLARKSSHNLSSVVIAISTLLLLSLFL